jgi:hypothetical protein
MHNNTPLFIVSILGILAPIAAIYINNLFQSKQKKMEYSNALDSVWFERKVKAAEAITSHYSIVIGGTYFYSELYEKFKTIDPKDLFALDHYIKVTERGMKKTDDIDTTLVNSLSLYFPISDSDSHKLYVELIEVQNQSIEVLINYNDFKTNPGNEELQMTLKISIEKIKEKYKEVNTFLRAINKIVKDAFPQNRVLRAK